MKRCAKLAAGRQEGLEYSPVADSVEYLSAYALILHRFRVALSVFINTEKALLKVKRMQFVHPTKLEASTAAAEQIRRSAGFFNVTGSEPSSRNTYAAYFSVRRHRMV